MQTLCDNKIMVEALNSFYEEETFELPKRLDEKNYDRPFKVLINHDLVETFGIYRYKLTFDYIHLLKKE